MKSLLLVMAVVFVGCGGKQEEEKAAEANAVAWVSDPSDPNNVKIEKEIRVKLKKPTGELTKVDLEKVFTQNLGNKQLTDVKGLEKLTQLKTLILNDNRLTEVKGLEKLRQLKKLFLLGNQLTDVKGLEELTNLTDLHLTGNKLSNVTGLEKLTQLESLGLRNNPDLTKAQITELQKALPKCAIFSNAKK